MRGTARAYARLNSRVMYSSDRAGKGLLTNGLIISCPLASRLGVSFNSRCAGSSDRAGGRGRNNITTSGSSEVGRRGVTAFTRTT